LTAKDSFKGQLAVLCAISFLAMTAVNLVIPIFSLYLATFHSSLSELGFVFSVNFISLIVFTQIAGYLSDIVGRKPLVVAGLLLNVISFYLFSLATDLVQVALVQILKGAAMSCIWGISLAIVGDLSTDKQSRNVGIFYVAVTAGWTVGPIFGGLLYEGLGVTSCFYGGSLLTAASFLLALLFLRETRKGDMRGKSSVNLSELRKSINLPVLGLLLTGLLCMSIQSSFWQGIFLFLFPLFATTQIGASPALASFCFTVENGVAALAQIPVGKYADRINREIWLVITILLSSVAAFFNGLIFDVISLLVVVGVNALFGSVIDVFVSALLMEKTPRTTRGSIVGIYRGLQSAGVVLGVTVFSWISDLYGLRSIFMFYAALSIFSAILVALLLRKH
jgi:MFS family permease